MSELTTPDVRVKQDADYVFFELTRSICPECGRVIDAHIVLSNGKVYMRKRCPDHGRFEALVYGDAEASGNLVLICLQPRNRGRPRRRGTPDEKAWAEQHRVTGRSLSLPEAAAGRRPSLAADRRSESGVGIDDRDLAFDHLRR